MFLLIYITCAIIILLILYLLARPIIGGAAYFPTARKNLDVIKKFAEPRAGDKIADLGSGDGRIVITLAQAGAEVHGYEINPLLVCWSRKAARREIPQGKIKIFWKSYWRADFSKYNTIVVYGYPRIMKRLGEKLKSELAPGTKVISNIYAFPNLKEIKSENGARLYVTP